MRRNGEFAITISRFFVPCIKVSGETVPARNSALVIAICDGSVDQVKQLLNVDGIDVNIREANDITYLHTAVFNNQVEIAKCLLSKGAEVGVLGGEVKSTPLHLAAEKGYFEMVKILMQCHKEDQSFGHPYFLDKNEIVAYLQQAIVQQKSELTLKWNNSFQDKPILMSELKSSIESTDDAEEKSQSMKFFKDLSETIGLLHQKRKITLEEWINWIQYKRREKELTNKEKSALRIQSLRNPDFLSWKQFFFDNSEGTMQINFEEDLKSFIKNTDFEKLLLEFQMSKPKLDYYIQLWSKKITAEPSLGSTITLYQWLTLHHTAGTDRDLEEIDWSELKEESKSPKTYWKNLGWGAILKLFFTALILGLAPSGFDLYKDTRLAIVYLTGDYYTYSVQNQTNLALMENCAWIGQTRKLPNENEKSATIDCDPDCSWLDPELDILSDNNQTTVTYDYSCFEKNPFWGWITLALVFLPGVSLFIRLICRQEVRNCAWKVCIAILASLFFPLTLLLTKIYNLFQFGEEWNRVGSLLTQCEGQVETVLQAGLQFYIILSRPDREASVFQEMAAYGSFVMIGFGQAKAAFAKRTPGASMSEDMKKMFFLTIWSFAIIATFIGSAVFMAIHNKVLFFVIYGIIGILALAYLFLTRLKSSCLPQNAISKSKLIMVSGAFLIGLINSIVCFVSFNMDPDPFTIVFWFKTPLLGNISLGIFLAGNLALFIFCLLFAFNRKFNDFLHTRFGL